MVVEQTGKGDPEGTARKAGGKQGECDVTESRSTKTRMRSIPDLGTEKSFTGCFNESMFKAGV